MSYWAEVRTDIMMEKVGYSDVLRISELSRKFIKENQEKK